MQLQSPLRFISTAYRVHSADITRPSNASKETFVNERNEIAYKEEVIPML